MNFSDQASCLEQLRTQYLDLVNRQLPERATQVIMPVRFNHCFARIVLDNLFQGCWYDYLSRKQPAYKQLDMGQLEQAIAIASKMLQSPRCVFELNEKSLRWRGKLSP
ncbi:MAG: hypothetical protein AAFQ40_00830 [Cyanobacteria bacterium J06623_5]